MVSFLFQALTIPRETLVSAFLSTTLITSGHEKMMQLELIHFPNSHQLLEKTFFPGDFKKHVL